MSAYGHRYKQVRAALLGLPCSMQLVCDGDPADSADHSPPLSRHVHVEGSSCCELRPACMRCQHEQARMLSMETKRAQREQRAVAEAEWPDCDEIVQSVEWL